MRTVIFVLLLLLCSNSYAYEKIAPKENIKQVVEIALDYSKKQKIDLSEYNIVSVEYQWYIKNEKIWVVQFMNKQRPEGDVFWITIDDATGEIMNVLYGE